MREAGRGARCVSMRCVVWFEEREVLIVGPERSNLFWWAERRANSPLVRQKLNRVAAYPCSGLALYQPWRST